MTRPFQTNGDFVLMSREGMYQEYGLYPYLLRHQYEIEKIVCKWFTSDVRLSDDL